MKDPGDQEDEVLKAALGQGAPNRGTAFALAECLVLHVRMGNVVSGPGRIGIAGHDPVRMGTAQLLPVETDVKTPQIDVAQYDGVGGDAQLVCVYVDLDLVELRT